MHVYEKMTAPISLAQDEEQQDRDLEALLPLVNNVSEPPVKPIPTKTPTLRNYRFIIAALINTIATVAIVFTNKTLFSHPQLRHTQITFATFHFALTALTLWLLSRPRPPQPSSSISAVRTCRPSQIFEAKRIPIHAVLPLAIAMILNVILPNFSLAYSSVTFYQISRALLTPATAVLDYVVTGKTVSRQAAVALVPVCVGVGIVSWVDANRDASGGGNGSGGEGGSDGGTALLGIVFAITGVGASAVYTVLIAKSHKTTGLSSMQLLLNQAPVSVLLLLYVVPFVDDIAIWRYGIEGSAWVLIGLSGICACAINVSQFYIINEAGPVSSTVVGHFKTCAIVALGWVTAGRGVSDGALVGVVMALGGIIAYSFVKKPAV